MSSFIHRPHGSWLGLSRVISTKSDIISFSVGSRAGTCTLEYFISGRSSSSKEFYHSLSISIGKRFFLESCGYCSQPDARDVIVNDKMEDGLPELETCAMADKIGASNAEEVDKEELLPELEFVEDPEKGVSSEKESATLELLNSFMGIPNVAVSDVLKKWAEDGNKLSKEQISRILVSLKKRQMYWKALQVMFFVFNFILRLRINFLIFHFFWMIFFSCALTKCLSASLLTRCLIGLC